MSFLILILRDHGARKISNVEICVCILLGKDLATWRWRLVELVHVITRFKRVIDFSTVELMIMMDIYIELILVSSNENHSLADIV